MKKHIQLVQCICCIMVFLFVCGALVPACSAHISTPQTNGEKTSPELPINKVKHTNNDDEAFFDFAIIWGPFEVRWGVFPLLEVVVYNRAPWYNNTMNVIGYQSWEHQWFFKKSWCVECYALHVGIVGKHWLCAMCFRNVNAW